MPGKADECGLEVGAAKRQILVSVSGRGSFLDSHAVPRSINLDS